MIISTVEAYFCIFYDPYLLNRPKIRHALAFCPCSKENKSILSNLISLFLSPGNDFLSDGTTFCFLQGYGSKIIPRGKSTKKSASV